MGEIKREPIKILAEGHSVLIPVLDPGTEFVIFDDRHTIADISRWIISEGWSEEVMYFLENPNG